MRQLGRAGIDPRQNANDETNDDKVIPTFGAFADECKPTFKTGIKNVKTRAKWDLDLGKRAEPIRANRIDKITSADVLAALESHYKRAPAMAREMRGCPTRRFPRSCRRCAPSTGLALVGLSTNATYARSLGSSDLTGWLLLALGLSADCAALALPSVAASAWKAGEKGTAGAWAVWLTVFAFALLGSAGFASASISDVTMTRNGRVTPQVTAAQSALADAMGARDRECHGKFCRGREAHSPRRP
jgi:hypothetical protein